MNSNSVSVLAGALGLGLAMQACMPLDQGSYRPSSVPSTTATVSSETPDVSDFMKALLEASKEKIQADERRYLAGCQFDPVVFDLAKGLAPLHNAAADLGAFGRKAEAVAVKPTQAVIPSTNIQLTTCSNNPTCEGPKGCSGMNAFAVSNVTFMLSPLIMASIEGGAFWGQLIEKAGGDPSAVNVEELYEGLGRIYLAHSEYRLFTVVDAETVSRILKENAYINDAVNAAIAFVIFHEIAHANLQHSEIKFVAHVGPEAILKSQGKTLTAEQRKQYMADLLKLSVYTETQADIYASTMLRRLEYKSDGPRVLFTGGMSALLVASGLCNSARTEEEFQNCAVMNGPSSTHPPLDVRATLLRRIVDDGEDLTAKIESFNGFDK